MILRSVKAYLQSSRQSAKSLSSSSTLFQTFKQSCASIQEMTLSNKKVLFVLTSVDSIPCNMPSCAVTNITTGWSLPDLTLAYAMFKQAGLQVDVASTKGGKTLIDHTTETFRQDPSVEFILKDPEFIDAVENTQVLSSFEGKLIDVLYFVGGFGAMWDFPFNPSINQLGREVYERGGIIAAVGHGTAALLNIRLGDGTLLVQGKRCCGTSNEEEYNLHKVKLFPEHSKGLQTIEDLLIDAGANYIKLGMFGVHTERDDRLVTGQNAYSTVEVADVVLSMLST